MPPPCYWCLSLHPRRPSGPRDRETFPAASGKWNVLIHFQNNPPPLNVFEEISIHFQNKIRPCLGAQHYLASQHHTRGSFLSTYNTTEMLFRIYRWYLRLSMTLIGRLFLKLCIKQLDHQSQWSNNRWSPDWLHFKLVLSRRRTSLSSLHDWTVAGEFINHEHYHHDHDS